MPNLQPGSTSRTRHLSSLSSMKSKTKTGERGDATAPIISYLEPSSEQQKIVLETRRTILKKLLTKLGRTKPSQP